MQEPLYALHNIHVHKYIHIKTRGSIMEPVTFCMVYYTRLLTYEYCSVGSPDILFAFFNQPHILLLLKPWSPASLKD